MEPETGADRRCEIVSCLRCELPRSEGDRSARRFEREVADVRSAFGFLFGYRGESRSRAEVRHMRRRFQFRLVHVVFPEDKTPALRVPARGGGHVVQQPVVVGAVQQGVQRHRLAFEQSFLRRRDPGLRFCDGLVAQWHTKFGHVRTPFGWGDPPAFRVAWGRIPYSYSTPISPTRTAISAARRIWHDKRLS